ncbi:hypothetical protein HHK36_013363 [Tetracentron sinense]|uniref:HotDog ACOT-type domain-containing protein n=1 Tax=Tetracentron sinense TaxID=13715 RepID=A0A835DFC5_TETSI|nr:hypothetical protein HHK36_013363 [Tetracentron sinense]
MKQFPKPLFYLSKPISIAFNSTNSLPKTPFSSLFTQSIPKQRPPKPPINTTFPSPKPNNGNTHISFQPKPINKTIFDQLRSLKFIQTRIFSSETPNPSQKSTDSMDSNSSPSNTIPAASTLTSPFEHSPPIDASSSIRKPLSLWPGMYHSPVTNALWEARSSIFERLLDPPVDAPPQSELHMKTPAQSRTSILYNFSSDYILREQYRDPWNEVRIGKLLEDLDALAGTISVKHCADDDSTTRPLLLVTASVDKMVLKKPIRADTDLKISGAVTWVGRSSIEIQMEVTQSTQESSNPSDTVALTANFTFVALDYKTGKSAPVNRLSPETEQEKILWEEAEARNKLRKRKKGEHRREFENGEVDRLELLLAEGRIFCDMPALADRDSILMRDTCLQNSLICQPQQRNIHGRIFGGFLMHRAFELAFSTAYAFAGTVPCFLEVDHVDFLRPVSTYLIPTYYLFNNILALLLLLNDWCLINFNLFDGFRSVSGSEERARSNVERRSKARRRRRTLRPKARKTGEEAEGSLIGTSYAALLGRELRDQILLMQVDVGDFLRFKSCVLYTELENPEQPLINIEVVAHVTRPELRSSEVSNTFYFTFTTRPEVVRNGLRIRNVVPATEEEARRVLERMDADNLHLVKT